jgi:putative oxidoreductase
MTRYAPYAYALLRIISGLLFACHGTAKLFAFPPGAGMGGGALPAYLVFGAWLELVGGLMIALGIFSSYAAFLCSGEMAVAYFMGHMAKGGVWPIVNKGELAVLFCFIFLYIWLAGPGIWSVTKK